ncbi:hypothetical protein D3C85_1655220 [compost metagenome]
MGRTAEQINPPLPQLDRKLGDALHRIDMEQDARIVGQQLTNPLNRLNSAYFIVHMHNADQDSFVR